jgi:hypothetical protein
MTPNEAAELMRRSQTTGAPTSEFNAAGGYDAVKALAAQNTTGYEYGVRTVADMAKYAPNDTIVRFDAGGQGGQGETFYASGNSATGGSPTTNDRLSDLTNQYSTLNTNYAALNNQLTALQKAYDTLVKKNTGTVGTTGGLTTGGVGVDTGGTNIDTSNAGGATTGPVYGPDGRMYSSAASAIAAGVTNYTRTKPTGALAGADNLGAGGGGTASRGFMSDATNSGNVNPGGLITGQNSQLFNPGININLPGGVKNPFAT